MPRLNQAKIVAVLLIIYVVIGLFAPKFDENLESNIVDDITGVGQPQQNKPDTGIIPSAINIITSIPVLGGLIGFIIDVTSVVTTLATYPSKIVLSNYPAFVKIPFAILGITTYIVVAFYSITVIKMLPTT